MMLEILRRLTMTLTTDFYILLALMLSDIAIGTITGFANGLLSSKINKEGMSRHFSILIFVIVLTYAFQQLGEGEVVSLLNIFYSMSYLISIIESLDKLGVPIPSFITDRLKQNNLEEQIDDNSRFKD